MARGSLCAVGVRLVPSGNIAERCRIRSHWSYSFVDDDADLCQTVRRLLLPLGYEVCVYHSADTFLAAGERHRSGCVLLDVRMPGISGPELHRQLVAGGSEIVVIIVSGHADIPMCVEAMRLGAVGRAPEALHAGGPAGGARTRVAEALPDAAGARGAGGARIPPWDSLRPREGSLRRRRQRPHQPRTRRGDGNQREDHQGVPPSGSCGRWAWTRWPTWCAWPNVSASSARGPCGPAGRRAEGETNPPSWDGTAAAATRLASSAGRLRRRSPAGQHRQGPDACARACPTRVGGRGCGTGRPR